MIRYDPTLVDLTKTFIYTIIHSGWSLALLSMKEKVNGTICNSAHKITLIYLCSFYVM